MIRIARTRSSGQRGYALVLVMVALVTLTILGVTGIQSAQLDMKITQNMRHHKQIQYGGLAGQDHARMLTGGWRLGDNQAREKFEAAIGATTSDGCTVGWIGSGVGAEDTPTPVMVNTTEMSTYTVDLCAGVCGLPTPGNSLDISGGSDDEVSTVALDMVATGSMTGNNSIAQMGGMLIGVYEGACDR